VKLGKSGIFTGRDVYYPVMGLIFLASFGLSLAYENDGVGADWCFAILQSGTYSEVS
jgi:hypothetical protein